MKYIFTQYRFSKFIVLFLTVFFFACKKETGDINNMGDGKTMLSVKIESPNRYKIASANGSELGNSKKVIHSYTTEIDGLQARISLEESNIGEDLGLSPSSDTKRNKLAATPIDGDILYRFILYEKATSTFVASVLGKTGTALNIPIERNVAYDWVAISYNNNIDPGANLGNTQATLTSGQEDLLRAEGVINPIPDSETQVSHNVSVTFKHKLSRLNLVVDATGVTNIARITNVQGQWSGTNYFANTALNVKTGATTIQGLSNPASITFVQQSPTIFKAVQYTAGNTPSRTMTNTINSISVELSDASTRSNTTTQTFEWPTLTFAEGKEYTLTIQFADALDISSFFIYTAGNNDFGYPAEQDVWLDETENFFNWNGVFQLVRGTGNFGPEGVVKTINVNWPGRLPPVNEIYTTTMSALASPVPGISPAENYKLLIVGDAYNPVGATDITAAFNNIINFVDNGGAVLYYGGRGHLPNSLERRLMKHYSGSNVVAIRQDNAALGNTDANRNANMSWRISRWTNNAMLNGSFGDARGKGFGASGADQPDFTTGDGHTSTSIKNFDPTKIDVLAYVSQFEGATLAQTPQNQFVSAFKAKGKNFFWFGDGEFTMLTNNIEANQITNIQGDAGRPFLMYNVRGPGTNGQPGPYLYRKPYIGPWHSTTYFPGGANETANSVAFGNIFHYILLQLRR